MSIKNVLLNTATSVAASVRKLYFVSVSRDGHDQFISLSGSFIGCSRLSIEINRPLIQNLLQFFCGNHMMPVEWNLLPKSFLDWLAREDPYEKLPQNEIATGGASHDQTPSGRFKDFATSETPIGGRRNLGKTGKGKCPY